MLETSERDRGGTGKQNRFLFRRLVSPNGLKRIRLAFVACSAAVCVLVMLADLASDVLVLKDLNELRLGESRFKGIPEIEAVFNATGRKTLVQRTLELWTAETEEEGVNKDTAQLLEVCDVLKMLFLGNGAGRSTRKRPNIQGLQENGKAKGFLFSVF